MFIFATSNSNYDWYLLKLNEKGEFIWLDVFGGNEDDVGADVAVGSDGNVYTIGMIGHTADMDPGAGEYNITTVNKYGASALVKVNSNGGLIYAVTFESTGNDYGNCLPSRMVVDNSQNIYITGYFYATIDFDPGAGAYPVSGNADMTPFVLKLARCKNVTTSSLNINTCNRFTLNNEMFDSTGIYTRTIPNSTGCDSVITLHLTIDRKTLKQSKVICEGESFYAGGNFQTVSGIYNDTLRTSQNCDSIVTTNLTVNPKPLPKMGPDRDLCADTKVVLNPGSFTQYLWQDRTTSNSFTVSTMGVYWVKVTNEFNCSATDSLIVTIYITNTG